MLYCLNPVIKISDFDLNLLSMHNKQLKRFNNFNNLIAYDKNLFINYNILNRCDFYPCGKCNLCLQWKRYDWILRALNEWSNWQNHYFITLTFDDEHYKNFWFEKKFFSNWVKFKLRKAIGSLTYLASQEFGETTLRKHYHVLLFTNYEFDDMQLIKKSKRNNYLYTSETLNSIWTYGKINQINLISSIAEIKYTCSYSIKELRNSKYNNTIPEQYEGEKLIIAKGFGNKFNEKSNVNLLPKTLIKNSNQRLYIAQRKLKRKDLTPKQYNAIWQKEQQIQKIKSKIKRDCWDINKYNQILINQLKNKPVKRKIEI